MTELKYLIFHDWVKPMIQKYKKELNNPDIEAWLSHSSNLGGWVFDEGYDSKYELTGRYRGYNIKVDSHVREDWESPELAGSFTDHNKINFELMLQRFINSISRIDRVLNTRQSAASVKLETLLFDDTRDKL